MIVLFWLLTGAKVVFFPGFAKGGVHAADHDAGVTGNGTKVRGKGSRGDRDDTRVAGSVKEVDFPVVLDGDAEVGGVETVAGGGHEDDVAGKYLAGKRVHVTRGKVRGAPRVDPRLDGGETGTKEGVAVVTREITDRIDQRLAGKRGGNVAEDALATHLEKPVGGVVKARGVAVDTTVTVTDAKQVGEETRGRLARVVGVEEGQGEDVVHERDAVHAGKVDDEAFRGTDVERAGKVGRAEEKTGRLDDSPREWFVYKVERPRVGEVTLENDAVARGDGDTARDVKVQGKQQDTGACESSKVHV
jgi:hypothetical protein